MEQRRIGPFLLNLDFQHVVEISRFVCQQIENFVGKVPTSSLIVRLDMSPWDGQGDPPVFEVETAAGGLMFWGLFPTFAKETVASLADAAICLWQDWQEPYKLLTSLTGWKLYNGWESVSTKARIYISPTGVQDVSSERRNQLITDPFCMAKKEGVLVEPGVTPTNIGEMRREYPSGFVLKPVSGWGSRDVFIYTNLPLFRKWVKTSGKDLTSILRGARGDGWVIQPFFPPEIVNFSFRKLFRIWRIYAVRKSTTEPFRVIGGTWNARPELKVHGASNNLVGAVTVEGGPFP